MSLPSSRSDGFLSPAVANDFGIRDGTAGWSAAQWLRIDGLLCSIRVGSFDLAVRITKPAAPQNIDVDVVLVLVQWVDGVGLLAVVAFQMESVRAFWLGVVVIEFQIVSVASAGSQGDASRSVDG